MKFPHYRQLDQMDCGPTCLRMIAKYFGRHYTAQTLREKANISKEGVSMLGIADAAESIGLRTVGVKLSIERLYQEVPLPCILHWGSNHFVVLYDIQNRPSVLGRGFLSKIWGGKVSASEDPAPYNEILSVGRNLSAPYEQPDRNLSFCIADPAVGLTTYTSSELEKKWVSTNVGSAKEGLALLIETTPRFYETESEKPRGLGFFQLLAYILRYKKLVIQLLLSMLLGSGFSLLFPFLTQSIVDIGIGAQNLPFIYLVFIAQMVLLCSTMAIEFLRSWILLHISVRLNLTILSEFLAKLMRLPVSFFDVKQLGDIMQRIGDHNRIEAFLTGQTLSILFSLLNLAVFGVALAYYDHTIFFVALVASAVYTGWVVLFLSQRRKLDVRRFDVMSRNQSQTIQLIQGMQDIKLSGAETLKRWEWERTQARLFKWNVKSLTLSQTQQIGGLLINQSKNILITFLAAKAVIDGNMTLGAMMSVQYILAQFNAPVEQMINFVRSWQDAQISLERLNEVHELPDEEPMGMSAMTTWERQQDIQLTEVSYTYPGAGNEPVLRKISLTIPYGKTTAIVGTSGSGKTTLLKLLLRFYDPDSGDIALITARNKRKQFLKGNADKLTNLAVPRIGKSLKSISHRAWRQQCGVVMQDGFIFSETIARNIAVCDEVIDQERLYQASQLANIRDFIESLPLGYHTKIGAEGNGISQGQKQRILIARSIYKNPQLLLFDEATNALDASNEAIIIRNLENFFAGRTVVVVAHRLSTVKHADQIIVMEKGEVVELGTHAELVGAKGKYFELVSNQLELAV
jgi:ATP-binding cassette subfamily B protein